MITMLNQLRRRRLALQQESDVRRARIEMAAAELAGRGALLARADSLVRNVAARPLAMSAVLVLVLLAGPGRIIGWAVQGVAWLGLARQIMSALRINRG